MGRDPSTPVDDLRSGDSSSRDRSDDLGPADLDRLASLDDRLGGHASLDDHADSPDGETPPEGLDAILLLRQLAAAESGNSPSDRELPRQIGRFAVVREVGRGGFARVYEAFDTRLLRHVALKVARPEAVLSVSARRRFVREAELAARLVHPHVVTIHEAGEAGGHVYIAEEFCPAGDLGAWLERHPGPLPPRVAARLVYTLAGAVAHSHGFCILHRDIKPANVLLVPAETGALCDGDAVSGRLDVKLADFGLGKFADPGADTATSELTRVGARVGTPAWMAPEQVDTAFGPVGPATDIHALGVLLDRLLTGRCVHAGGDDAESMRLVISAEPVPADRVVPGVPADLGAVTAKCLAKHPVDRYATVADFAADLARFLDGRPTVARPISPLGRAVRFVRRHRPLVAAIALALAASVVALSALALQSHQRWLLAQRAMEMRRLQAAATLRRGFESWRSGDVEGAFSQLDACHALDPRLADSLAGRWLRTRLHGEEAILFKHQERGGGAPVDLYCVAVSPDAATVAVGGADGVLSILRVDDDAATGAVRRVVLHDEINDVAFSPDGSRLATVGQDGRVCLCAAADGALVAEWRCDDGPLFAVAWSPDGESLACGGASRAVRILTVADATAESAIIRPFDPLAPTVNDDPDIESLLFVAPDRLAATCGNRAAIVDPRTGRIVHEFVGHDGTVTHLAASPDGRRLVTAGTDRQPRVWDAERGEEVASLAFHPSWVLGCRFSADGDGVVTGCRDGVVRVHALRSAGPARSLVGHVGRVWDVATLPDGRILSVGSDGTLRRWDGDATLESAGVRELSVAGAGVARAVPLERSGGLIVALRDTGEVVRFGDDGRASAFGLPGVSARGSLAVDDVHGRLAASDQEHSITTSPIPGTRGNGMIRRLPAGLAGSVFAWAGDAGLLVGGMDGRLGLWLDDAERALSIDDLGRNIDAIDVTDASGTRTVAVVVGKTIRLYELSAKGVPRAGGTRTLATLPATTGNVGVVSFAPDGKSLVIGTNVGGVERYDVATGLSLGTFARHSTDIRTLEWSSDGRTLVSADAEIVRFSDVHTTTVLDEYRPGWTIESAGVMVGDGGAATFFVVGNDPRRPVGRERGRIALAPLDSR